MDQIRRRRGIDPLRNVVDRARYYGNIRRGAWAGVAAVICCLAVLIVTFAYVSAAQRKLAGLEKEGIEMVRALQAQTVYVKHGQANTKMKEGLELLQEVIDRGEKEGAIDQEKLDEAIARIGEATGKLREVESIYRDARRLEERERAIDGE